MLTPRSIELNKDFSIRVTNDPLNVAPYNLHNSALLFDRQFSFRSSMHLQFAFLKVIFKLLNVFNRQI